MSNVKFTGIEEDLTAPNAPWIYYGVSSGGFYLQVRSCDCGVCARDLTRAQEQHT